MGRIAGAAFGVCIGVLWAGTSWAQTSATRNTSFQYDQGSGLLTQEVVEPNTSSLRLQKDYSYDGFGNKTGIMASGVDIATRSSSVTYDARGQFAVTNTNALSQQETFEYDPRFGQPTKHTGPNGVITTWQYDALGRKILEIRADGTQSKWFYVVCSPATCPAANQAYYIASATFAADGVTKTSPWIAVVYDILDREVDRATEGFDGTFIDSETVYDSLGRVAQKARPHFRSVAASQWTTFTYDALGRVLSKTDPDNSVTSQAYHGLVTSVTNGLNQTVTTTKDSQGQTVSVTDAAGGIMTYGHDAFGNATRTTDPVGNVVTNSYDARGRKIASSDPDLGTWSYAYNTLDQLVSQTDAKGQVTTVSYDLLGRTIGRVEPDMTAAWVYDTALHGIGKLTSASITAGPDAGYQRSYAYDTLGRPVQAATTISGTTYTFAAGYDANSRLSQLTYPTGFALSYTYTNFGYSSELKAAATGQVYWTANARDAEMHLTSQTAGNGVVTTRSYDPHTGRLIGVQAGPSNAVANFSFNYDVLGNLTSRADATQNVSESFTYDNLNRLTQSNVALTPTPLVKTFSYNPIGNLLAKTDVGNYLYPAAGTALPHAVTGISGGTISTTFTYDGNGNQTAGLGRSIAYTSYDKPASITQGATTLFFSHDPDHQRFKKVESSATTLYFDVFGVHAELVQSATSTWSEFLMTSDGMVGVRYQRADETITTRYFTQDHLGSIAVLTDESGVVVERLSYDAWGRRRFANGTDDPAGSITSQTTRGFTAQENLDAVGLVHLNGRVYDPIIGRMMSADPFVPGPTNAQAWNRYSYVINNPLSITDPNGYCFLGLCTFAHNVGHTLKGLVPTLKSIAILAASTIVCGPYAPACAILVATAINTIVAGVTTGKIGPALMAGANTMLSAIAMNVVGGMSSNTLFAGAGYGVNVAGHALAGCISAVGSGSSCQSGALAGGVTAAAGPIINRAGFVAGLVANSVLGGLASVAGGGKFANGAVTAAFGYLFNYLMHLDHTREGFLAGAIVGTGVSIVCDGATVGICAPANLGIVPVFTAAGTLGGLIADTIESAWNIFKSDSGGDKPEPRSATPEARKAADEAATDKEGKLRCFYCNGEMTTEPGQPNSRQYDHRVPYSKGGTSGPENIVGACRTCNLEKGPKALEQWKGPLH